MNIFSFEKQISSVILSRGIKYYKSGKVIYLNCDNNAYIAEVDGTDLYTVKVKIDEKGKILSSLCTCPYDSGNVCKHEVAVYFAIRDKIKEAEPSEYHDKEPKVPANDPKIHYIINGEDDDKVKLPDASLKANKKDKYDILYDTIKNMTKEQLEELLFKSAKMFDPIRKEILYLNCSDSEKEREAKDLIRGCLSQYRRGGFINYRNARASLEGARHVLENARREKPITAVKLCITVISTVFNVDMDDSDGCLGDVLFESFNIINDKIENSPLTDDEKKQLFQILSKESDRKKYEGWHDFKLDFLSSCISLCDISPLRYNLEEKLDKMLDNCKEKDSISGEIKKIKYELIKRYGSEREAMLFVNRNLDDENFRKIAIESALNDEDYDYALELLSKLSIEKQNLIEWLKYRLSAYEGKKDTEKFKETLIKLIISGEADFF